MRIECPSCSAAYDVPEARLAPGRVVKCARCATPWTPIPLEIAAFAPLAPPPPLPDPLPPDPLPPDTAEHEAGPEGTPKPEAETDPEAKTATPAQETIPEPAHPVRARSIPLIAAWVLSLVILAVLAWGAIDRRAAIMHAWPASTRAYAAVGLATK